MRIPHFDRFVQRTGDEVLHSSMRPVYTIDLCSMRLYSCGRK